MAKQLLSFVRGVEGERRLVKTQSLFKEVEKLIKATFPSDIKLYSIYGASLGATFGDATQLQQVLLNLCVNARDAMPRGGALTLEVQNMEIKGSADRDEDEMEAGNYVAWSVSDTGTGIPPDIVERIFEPFFSTKDPDKGTGLGLSTVLGIVKSHGGYVQVASSVGKGSTFTVYLPIIKKLTEEMLPTSKSPADRVQSI